MQVAFAGFKTDIPADWQDESTMVFSMRADAGLSAPMSLNPQRAMAQANIAISWEAAAGMAPQQYLDARLESLPKLVQGFELKGRGDAGQAGEPIPFAEYTVAGKTPMVQWLGVKRLGDTMVVLTGTALAKSYDKAKPHFLEAARGLVRG